MIFFGKSPKGETAKQQLVGKKSSDQSAGKKHEAFYEQRRMKQPSITKCVQNIWATLIQSQHVHVKHVSQSNLDSDDQL